MLRGISRFIARLTRVDRRPDCRVTSEADTVGISAAVDVLDA